MRERALGEAVRSVSATLGRRVTKTERVEPTSAQNTRELSSSSHLEAMNLVHN